MTYFLAPSLAQLRSEINARWPARDKGSDGWVGDTSHSARKSDHNPDYAAGGVVRAIDVDKDGINVDALLGWVLADARAANVIWNRRIWIRGVGWRPYTGANGHTHHVHISIRHGAASERSTAPWSAARQVSTVHDKDSTLTARGPLSRTTITLTPPSQEEPMLVLSDAHTNLVAVVFPSGKWALIQDPLSASNLRAATGVASATVDTTTWNRMLPASNRLHTL